MNIIVGDTRQLDPFDHLDYSQRMQLWQAPVERQFKYTPQDYQSKFHKSMGFKIKAVGGGVGAAKTYTTSMDYMHELLAASARASMGYGGPDGTDGRIAIAGPDYKQPTVAFEYLRRVWEGLGMLDGDPSMGHERQWMMRSKNNVEVVTITGRNPMAFAAKPYSVVHLCEAMQMPASMLNAAMERVSRWPGPFKGKVYCEGTFEDDGYAWFAERCKAWDVTDNRHRAKFFSFPSWLNTFNYPGGWDDPEIQGLKVHYQEMGQERLFMERIGGQPPTNQSDLWAQFFQPSRAGEPWHVHPDAVFDPRFPVDVAIDPATHRYAVLFIQWPDEETCNVIGEIVLRKTSFEEVRASFWETPWADNITQQASLIAIDRAALQHHAGMDAHYDLWTNTRDMGGMGLTPVYTYLHLDTGLEIMRHALNGTMYKLRINPSCQELIDDFHKEKRDRHGMVSMAINRGHDDARKALTYYLAQKVGWTTVRRPRRIRQNEPHHMLRANSDVSRTAF